MSPRASTPSTTLRGRWLVVGRIAWVAVAILTMVVFVSGLPSEFARLRIPCADVASCAWVPRLTAADARELGQLGLSGYFFAAYFVALEVAFMVVSCAIGAAIFWRKSDDRMALFLRRGGTVHPVPGARDEGAQPGADRDRLAQEGYGWLLISALHEGSSLLSL